MKMMPQYTEEGAEDLPLCEKCAEHILSTSNGKAPIRRPHPCEDDIPKVCYVCGSDTEHD